MKARFLIILAICILVSTSDLNALECPKHPEQSRKDWDIEVNLAVARIGPAKGLELETEVKNATRDLLGKFPNADRVYLEQMMYATYCSALRDDETITEYEKAMRVKEYNEELRKAFAISPSTKTDKESNSEKKSTPLLTKLIRGTTTILKRNRTDLDELARSFGIERFDLSLDDPILSDYYVIKLRLENDGRAIEQPLTFTIFTGTKSSKIMDVQQKVHRPQNKTVKMKYSIPNARWTWPESGVKSEFVCDCPSCDEGRTGFNIYRSLLRNIGYGRINPTVITSSNLEIYERTRIELFPAYYRISSVSRIGFESDLSEPVELQNIAPIKSFIRKKPSGKEPIPTSDSMTEDLLDESELTFAQGRVDITFTNGIDSSADIYIYLLCKVLLGSELTPTVSLDGNPSIQFTLKHKSPPVQIPSVYFEPDKLREALTPLEVKWYASSESVYLQWEKPKATEFTGVRIFRTPERQPGDLREVSKNQEIYDGTGLVKRLRLLLPDMGKLFFTRPSSRSEGNLYLLYPAKKLKPVESEKAIGSNDIVPPGAPTNFHMHVSVRLDSDYYIDTPAEQHMTFTYIIYGYDKDGNVSYPVIVNAALAEPNEGVTAEAIEEPEAAPDISGTNE